LLVGNCKEQQGKVEEVVFSTAAAAALPIKQ
jgi:hypothetical protein